jgi:hypothetical protein
MMHPAFFAAGEPCLSIGFSLDTSQMSIVDNIQSSGPLTTDIVDWLSGCEYGFMP